MVLDFVLTPLNAFNLVKLKKKKNVIKSCKIYSITDLVTFEAGADQDPTAQKLQSHLDLYCFPVTQYRKATITFEENATICGFNFIPDGKILDGFKLKAFAENKMNVAQIMIFVFDLGGEHCCKRIYCC